MLLVSLSAHPSHVLIILFYNRSIPTIAPAAVASKASRPPAGNRIARPAAFGFDEAAAVDDEGVGDEPEEVEPAPAEAVEPGEDAADDASEDAADDASEDAADDAADDAAPVSALDASVAVAVDAVLVALAFTGAVM